MTMMFYKLMELYCKVFGLDILVYAKTVSLSLENNMADGGQNEYDY